MSIDSLNVLPNSSAGFELLFFFFPLVLLPSSMTDISGGGSLIIPSNIELDKRQRGKALRDQLRDLLWRRGLSRPAGIGGMISQRDRHNREVKVDNLV